MSWLSRVRNVMFARRLDQDLAEEMRDHLERRSAELRDHGMDPVEARRQALLMFGNRTQIRERSHEIRLWTGLEITLQDLRYAFRGLRRSPAMASTAILSLALAIGSNTAIYSILDAALLRPLPVPQPDRLVSLASPGITQPGEDPADEREAFNYPLYLDFRKAAGNSVQLALASYVNRVDVVGPENGALTEKVNQTYVSGDLFQILGVSAALGRTLSSADDRAPGISPVVVLSYDYWQRRFNGNPHVLGKSVHLDTYSSPADRNYEIVGIAQKGFFGVEPGKFVDAWMPAMLYNKEAFTNPGWGWFRIVGRTAPGVSSALVQARLQPTFHRYQSAIVQRMPTMPAAIKAQFTNASLRVHPADDGVSGFRRDFAKPLWIVFAVAAGIFMVACANVASLLLARATARSGEMALRISLGANRSRLIRQLLTENLLLAVLAGGLGWVLASVTAPVLVSLLSTQGNPVRFALAIDTRVLLFCAAVSALATVFFGLLPACRAAAVQPIKALRGMTGQSSRLRLGRVFVAVQVAFAFCLVVAGAAFLFSLWNLFAVNTGFDTRNVTVLSLSNDRPRTQKEMQQKEMQQADMQHLQDLLRAEPGVSGVAIAPWAIFEGSGWTDQVLVPSKPPSEREEIFYRVSPGYFATLRTPILEGRDFGRQDRPNLDPIPTIVNVAFAQRYLGGIDIIGKFFERAEGKKRVRQQVIGLVANAHYGSLRTGAEPIAYLPVEGTGFIALYVRSPLDAGSVARLVENIAKRVGPGLRLREVTTLNTLVGNTLLKEKLLASIGGTFAFLGLLLAAIGLFGLLNYSVTRRIKEMGIRAALGAQRPELVLLVMRDLAGMVGGGLITGLVGSLVVLVTVRSLLFGIKAADPVVLMTATIVFILAGITAAGLPARRAARVDPMVALRQE